MLGFPVREETTNEFLTTAEGQRTRVAGFGSALLTDSSCVLYDSSSSAEKSSVYTSTIAGVLDILFIAWMRVPIFSDA